MNTLFPESKGSRIIEAIYEYRDETGNLVYQKIRYAGKKFTQRRPDGEGGWIYGLKAGWYEKGTGGWRTIKDAIDPKKQPHLNAKWFPEIPRLIYRKQQIIAAIAQGQIVLFTEGEKDSDNAQKIGFEATTTGGAAEPWQDIFGESLRNAKLVFIPDADPAGRKLFEKYAPELVRFVAELRCLDLPEGHKDLSDWLATGHSTDELKKLIEAAPVWSADASGPVAEILDKSPETIRRPLCIINNRSYAASWVSIQQGDKKSTAMVIITGEGLLYTDAPLPDAHPLSELGIVVSLKHIPATNRIWSGLGVKQYLRGERSKPLDVFNDVVKVVNYYMDFNKSLAPQHTLAELVGLYIMVSYFLDAFNVVGYIWPTGDKGTGKTKTLLVITELAYLAQLILAGGSYAAIRDIADYGGTSAFDDAEAVMDVKRTDPDKRAILLTGNRRGTYITIKEMTPEKTWKTIYIDPFGQRAFSAIRLPDDVLASRTITIPLVRSADPEKSTRDPADHDTWPINREPLIDALWNIALAELPIVRSFDRIIPTRVHLAGRDLEPWRALLAVALWLQEKHGATGLFERMEALSRQYQIDRSDFEHGNPVRVAIMSLQRMLNTAGNNVIDFTPSELAEEMNKIATEEEIDHFGEFFTNARKVGILLRRLRFKRAQRSATGKKWQISSDELKTMAQAYSLPVDHEPGNTANAVNAVPADNAVIPEGHHNGYRLEGMELFDPIDPIPDPKKKIEEVVWS